MVASANIHIESNGIIAALNSNRVSAGQPEVMDDRTRRNDFVKGPVVIPNHLIRTTHHGDRNCGIAGGAGVISRFKKEFEKLLYLGMMLPLEGRPSIEKAKALPGNS